MDKVLKKALLKEEIRQKQNVELIASENYVSPAILELQGSILTNKYAEGYPGKRYYGGCEYIDIFEQKAIDYAKQLFGAKYANVQPHSGSSANLAVYRALLQPGDKVMGMNLSNGGHLTHGYFLNFSGQDYKIITYDVSPKTGIIDYEQLRQKAIAEKPSMIIAGASAYSRLIDFQKFRTICDEIGAYLMVDMAHIAGLVAAGLHPNPIAYADVVTSTTHKTLRGPRGGLILCNDKSIAQKIDKTVFPGIQGGPLMHVIAAKAQCFYEALQPSFKKYQKQVLKNILALANTLKQEGFPIISDTTENHLILVDVKTTCHLTGIEAQNLLDSIQITVNKNTIPAETERPMVASGIRLGSPAMTTRGFREKEFQQIGHIIAQALKNSTNKRLLKKLRDQVIILTAKFPIKK